MDPQQRRPADEPAGAVLNVDLPDLRSTDERTIVDLEGAGPLVSLGRYRYLTSHKPLPIQRHADLLVLVVPLRGSFTVIVDGEDELAQPRDVLCIPPGTPYATGREAEHRGELMWLITRCTHDPGSDVDRDDPFGLWRAVAALRSGRRRWIVSEPVADLLGRALEVPEDLSWAVRQRRRLLAGTALLTLLTDRDDLVHGDVPVHPGVRRAVRYIAEHLDSPLSISELAAQAQMSTTQFHASFVAALGTSPKDYVLRTKIDRAEEMLADPDLTVTAVAHALGFSSSQRFAEVFRRYKAMTPTGFRRSGHQDRAG